MPAKTVKEVLKASRELIEEPKQWIKNKYVSADEKRFCAAGAIKRIDGPSENKAKVALAVAIVEAHPEMARSRHVQNYLRIYSNYGQGALLKVAENYPEVVITSFNDQRVRTHGDILEVFDAAIAAE